MEGLMIMKMIKSLGWVMVIAVLGLCTQLYKKILMVRKKLERQGIKGPPPSLFSGNVPEMQHHLHLLRYTTTPVDPSRIVAHDYTSSLFPYLYHWRQRYGRVYTYSTGLRQHVYVNQPELVRELNQAHTLSLGKVTYVTKRLRPILGRGVIASNGPLWAHQRRLIAPEFFNDKVKGMVGLMVESAMPMLRKWEERVGEGDIRVDEDLRTVSADVISRACFGSSFSKGKEIFSKLRSLQKAVTQQSILFTLHGFAEMLFGAGNNKRSITVDDLEKEVESLIWETVKRREKECANNFKDKDLLQLILESAMSTDDKEDVGTNKSTNNVSYKSFVVDNCKNIYFAGHETTAVAASWCLMLLALNPQWQSRIREEVSRVCKDGLPDADSIPHLKTVKMVIQETLRLYPPGAFVAREALEEMRIGSIVIPKGVCIWTLIPTLHRDPEIWGHDANEFKPERFKDGVSKACKHPQAYIPFGLGARLCLGKNFGMVELKVLISLIVSRFTFSLSTAYQHSPEFRMLVEPKHGVLLRLTARHGLSCHHM